ncbi:YfjI family protein [Sphingobium sp. KCTC 72723]|uniref:YfjI family protein n=1 Tax=Sphingobium sp. KCTC 72723 TaxID=2733867 RepID=UPI00165E1E18|nr:YfjI family protein [Sphingobium sp. KCTC 72723]
MADMSDAAHAEAMRNAGWDPKPLRQDSHSQDYPVERLPSIIKQAVQEVADHSQAPVALVAASALSAVSAVVQTQFSVSRNGRLHGPASLFFLTVAESGERKTAVDSEFMRPIRDWEARQRQEKKRLDAEYQQEWEAWDRQEGERGDPPQKPGATPRMLRGDDTSEALLKHLSDYPIAAVISSEAGVVFGSHAMKPEQVTRSMAQTNSLWDGGPIVEGRIGRGEINLESVRVTMGLMLQPNLMQKFISQNDGLARGIGFLARFLFSHPETTMGTRFYKEPGPMLGLADFHQRAMLLLQAPAATDELGRLITNHIRFDENAQSVWINFLNQVEEYLGGDGIYSGIRDVASKAAENAARIACCLHVFAKPNHNLIDRKTMADACALMRWYLNEAVRFGRQAEATQEVRNAELLEGWLIQKYKEAGWEKRAWEMTVNTARRMGPGALRGGKRIDDAFELLHDLGRVRLMQYPGTKKRYVVIAPQVIAQYS